MLALRSVSIDDIIPSPRYITTRTLLKPEDIARSQCLDLEWSQLVVNAENDEGTNVTKALYVHLMKVYNKEKRFDFSQMLTKYATCIPSAWEILINGHWVPVNMSFTSGVFNGKIVPKSQTIGLPYNRNIARDSLRRTYEITKLDYCQQVNVLMSFKTLQLV